MRKAPPAAVAMAAAGLGSAAPLLAVLLAGYTASWRDTGRLFAPLRPLVVEALRDLHLPLWNPHEAFGLPLFAQLMHGVLHPVTVASAFLAPHAGMDAILVVYLILASTGAAVAARSLDCSPGAAAVAGLAYGLSGYVLSMTSIVQYLAAAATAPWAIAALVRAGSSRGVALAALAVAALLFAGDPQWALIAALLGIVLAAGAGGRKRALAATAAAALGTALAAVQLVPTWVYLQESVRGSLQFSEAERAHWAFSPWRLPELFAPGFFSGVLGETWDAPVYLKLGHPPVAADVFSQYFVMPFVPSVFIGAAVLALALRGAASRAGRILAGAAILLLWLSFGAYAGAEQLLHPVPVWGTFRYAEKLVGPLTLAISLLAALGADRLDTLAPRNVWLAACALAVSGAAAVALGAGLGDAWFRAAGAGDAAGYARWRLAVGLYHATGAIAGITLLFFAVRRLRHPQWAAAILVFAQSCAAAVFALHAGARSAIPDSPLRSLRADWGIVRIATPLRGLLQQAPAGFDALDSQLGGDARMGVPPFSAADRIDQIQTYTGLPPLQAMKLGSALGSDFATPRRFGLTHVVLRDFTGSLEEERMRSALAQGRRVLDDRSWKLGVWEVPHRPWAFFARTAAMVTNNDDALRALVASLRGGGPDVILEGEDPKGFSPGKVLKVDRRAETVAIEAEADGDGLLVVADSWWPGWIAEIDGRPAQIQRADAALRAVQWPAGRHTLMMRYQPREVRIGILVTLAAAIASVVLALRRARTVIAAQ